MTHSTVIVGAGQAASQAAQSLRQWGYSGKICIVGAEPFAPYQRPPLSKAYLKGDLSEERLLFKPASWYEDQQIELRLSTRALMIDRSRKTITLEGGLDIAYDALILCTGSRPRQLQAPGFNLNGVHDLRSLDDVTRLRPLMTAGRKLVLIGAGFIGLEAAAAARQMGLDVTVVEMAERVLSRVTSPLVSAFYEKEHLRKGVKIVKGARLEELKGRNNTLAEAVLHNGMSIEADLILAGIGILPNVELAEQAGLTIENGIATDHDARTSDPSIFAAGDCASRPLVHYDDRRGRLESVHNAIEQGKLAAAAILGKPRPPQDVPWFWSDQYDLKLQTAGLLQGYDETIVRGDPDSRKFSAFYLRSGRILAVDAINSPPDFMASKRLIAEGTEVPSAKLEDPEFSLRELL